MNREELISKRKGKEEIKEALRRLHQARPEQIDRVKKEAAKLFKEVDPKQIVFAEQELIREGVERQEMRRACDVHLEIMKEMLGAQSKKMRLPSWHPIQISMDEHKIIKRNLNRLKNTLRRLRESGSFKRSKPQTDRLKELAHFFLETEKHHKREEEALFPRLEAHGVTEPPQIFKEDHVEFLAKKRQLYDIAVDAESMDFKDFIDSVSPIIEYLAEKLKDHIYKEDNILYPMSLQVLGKEEWRQVRKKFDAIGYCCFAPADLGKRNKANR